MENSLYAYFDILDEDNSLTEEEKVERVRFALSQKNEVKE